MLPKNTGRSANQRVVSLARSGCMSDALVSTVTNSQRCTCACFAQVRPRMYEAGGYESRQEQLSHRLALRWLISHISISDRVALLSVDIEFMFLI